MEGDRVLLLASLSLTGVVPAYLLMTGPSIRLGLSTLSESTLVEYLSRLYMLRSRLVEVIPERLEETFG